MNGPLYRHPTDKVIGGVAAGIGAWVGIDPVIVRVAWVLLTIFTTGVFLLVYVVLLFVVPLAPAGWSPPDRPRSGPTSSPGAAPGGWQAPGGGWSPEQITGGNAGLIAGVILIALGAWFLIDRFITIDWSLLLPVMLMLAGVGIIVAMTRRGGAPG